MARLWVRIAFAGVALLIIDTALAQITSATVTGCKVAPPVDPAMAATTLVKDALDTVLVHPDFAPRLFQ
jgi:hypothetical protein